MRCAAADIVSSPWRLVPKLEFIIRLIYSSNERNFPCWLSTYHQHNSMSALNTLRSAAMSVYSLKMRRACAVDQWINRWKEEQNAVILVHRMWVRRSFMALGFCGNSYNSAKTPCQQGRKIVYRRAVYGKPLKFSTHQEVLIPGCGWLYAGGFH